MAPYDLQHMRDQVGREAIRVMAGSQPRWQRQRCSRPESAGRREARSRQLLRREGLGFEQRRGRRAVGEAFASIAAGKRNLLVSRDEAANRQKTTTWVSASTTWASGDRSSSTARLHVAASSGPNCHHHTPILRPAAQVA